MNRTEFLDTLRSQLSGQMHEGKVAAHVRYYEDYIQSQVRKGRNEQEVLAELGDPRLIARTLLDTDVDNGQVDYEEYSTYSDNTDNSGEKAGEHVHVWRFDTWYSKLLGIVILLIIVFLLFHILVAVIPFFAILAVVLFVISLIKNRS
ncbi:DUF1700 domain-containing protein [Blautia sp. HCP3S3_H10_1]|uniref:DUF1700 domain-containing protein n=1 Tax=unclassified Blautia TaxID=2648079 RepID=UPI003F8EDB5C|nr:DUF1700 domain-containing protein [Clostridia bacterium]